MTHTQEYMTGLMEKIINYDNETEALVKERKNLCDSDRWDEAKVLFHKIEERKANRPYTTGQNAAVIAYANDNEVPRVEEFLWEEDDCIEMVRTFRQAEIKEFVYMNESTAALRNLYSIINAGCTVVGTRKFAKSDMRFQINRYDIALVIRVNEEADNE